jgi:hypothetical protein
LRCSYLRNAADRHPVAQWSQTDVAFLAADLKVTPEWVRSHVPEREEPPEPAATQDRAEVPR